jgi:hypothetical protein
MEVTLTVMFTSFRGLTVPVRGRPFRQALPPPATHTAVLRHDNQQVAWPDASYGGVWISEL